MKHDYFTLLNLFVILPITGIELAMYIFIFFENECSQAAGSPFINME